MLSLGTQSSSRSNCFGRGMSKCATGNQSDPQPIGTCGLRRREQVSAAASSSCSPMVAKALIYGYFLFIVITCSASTAQMVTGWGTAVTNLQLGLSRAYADRRAHGGGAPHSSAVIWPSYVSVPTPRGHLREQAIERVATEKQESAFHLAASHGHDKEKLERLPMERN